MAPSELKDMTLAVCNIAKSAGSYIREERKKFSLQEVERKHAHDYVSYVDKGSETLIVAELRRLLPEAGFITEEGSASHDSEQFVWVIDPLDGTTNFIHQYAPYAVSIALMQGTQIIIGVVYEICADECFYAWQGGGAYMNGKPLQVSQQEIEDALICLQLPYNSDAYKPLAKHFIDTFYGRCASIRMSVPQRWPFAMWQQAVLTVMPNSTSANGTTWPVASSLLRLVALLPTIQAQQLLPKAIV